MAMTAGVIAGAVLQAARRTAGLTQEDLAAASGVSVDTVKRWENGQRPLGNVRAGELARIRRVLRREGARPVLLGRLHAAIDADEFTGRAIGGDCTVLASEVTTRPWSCLVSWAATGTPPAEAADVAGPRPLLSRAQRAAFFASVRDAVERSPAGDAGALLRHQGFYVAAWDTSPEGGAWLAGASRAELGRARGPGTWNPGWAVTRSVAVSAACQGDPEPLSWFIRTRLEGVACDEANLNYWAYWAGDESEPASGEEFMVERRLDVRRAGVLLHHLAGNLSANLPYAELSAESLRSLLRRWPGLLRSDPAVASALEDRTGAMLDCSAPGRPGLSDLHLAARRARGHQRRTA